MPMTETSFYILFALQNEMHGYSIMKHVKALTKGEIDLGAGTVYTSLSKMEKDGLIGSCENREQSKFYKITDLGREILDIEILRIERLYKNTRAQGGM